ncbi:hypothetical protein FNV43_RR07207 [Rhamnella rubrinervis]|uniref:Prefoldin subunit 6 n=1 Tax=Rhamnella rubrinervis TaxID=2594499 RepID=A0A8K0HDP1_9ROSA|nr:hypothetical protein FNV43_RR06003 [Rhamnella rubrinervis]KAF3451118.1 hypothetical protein FNV43_RR07207 [Rhamnella rubrinervis]
MGSPSVLKELQRELENVAKNHQVRKKYTIQLGENELVLKELDLLEEDANVYKLIGPVLVKQDLAEANANVRKRIEYISAEFSVVGFGSITVMHTSGKIFCKDVLSYISMELFTLLIL